MKLVDSNGDFNHIVPVSSGLLKPPHVKQIGPAMALFLKLEDMVTTGRGNDGVVLGGKPVTDEELGQLLGQHAKTAGKHRRRLKAKGYVDLKRTPIGYTITVKKSKKWTWIKARTRSQNATSREQNAPSPEPFGSALETDRLPAGAKSLHPDQTKRGLNQDEAASSVANSSHSQESIWGFLKIDPCGPLPFRNFLEGCWNSRNGDLPSVVIGTALDAWKDTEGGNPQRCATLFQALAELRKHESAAKRKAPRIPTTKEMIPTRGSNERG